MLTIFAVMCAGMIAGWLFRRSERPRLWAPPVTTATILVLMALLGTQVGANDYILRNLGTIGLTSVALGVGIVAGLIGLTQLLWRYSFRKVAPSPQPGSRSATAKGGGNRFSILVIAVFTAGITLGALTPLEEYLSHYPLTIYTLYVMMFSVGITIGNDTQTLRNMVRQPRASLWVPVVTLAGTWISITAAWIGIRLLGGAPPVWSDTMAVGSAFGYYSLSGVLLGELRGAEIGTIALLTNITRELVTVVATPWMARRFSPLAPICCGGATALDVTLPGIIRYCGPHYIPLAIFQGVIADLSVPFLVPFFASFQG